MVANPLSSKLKKINSKIAKTTFNLNVNVKFIVSLATIKHLDCLVRT